MENRRQLSPRNIAWFKVHINLIWNSNSVENRQWRIFWTHKYNRYRETGLFECDNDVVPEKRRARIIILLGAGDWTSCSSPARLQPLVLAWYTWFMERTSVCSISQKGTYQNKKQSTTCSFSVSEKNINLIFWLPGNQQAHGCRKNHETVESIRSLHMLDMVTLLINPNFISFRWSVM